jgi:hypothetical protein
MFQNVHAILHCMVKGGIDTVVGTQWMDQAEAYPFDVNIISSAGVVRRHRRSATLNFLESRKSQSLLRRYMMRSASKQAADMSRDAGRRV